MPNSQSWEYMSAYLRTLTEPGNFRYSCEPSWEKILDIPVNLQQGIIKDLSVKLLSKWC